MTPLGYVKNEFGTVVSQHKCKTCGFVFTVCPAAEPGSPFWDNCLDTICDSYDKSRDMDLLFDDPEQSQKIQRRPMPKDTIH